MELSSTAVKKFVTSGLLWFRDALFPVYCLGCGQEGTWVCSTCLAQQPPIPIQRCIFCGIVSALGKTCTECQRHSLESVSVVGDYHEWLWRSLIFAWKYGGARDLDAVVGQAVAQAKFLLDSNTVLIPIPLALRRERDRGFNQSAVLAQHLAEVSGASSLHALKRVKKTRPQSEVGPKERKENVKHAFKCIAPASVEGKQCVLVDDIATTGATLEEAAKVLKSAGAASVNAIALLRSDIRLAQ